MYISESSLIIISILASIGSIWFLIVVSKCIWILIKICWPNKNFIQRYGNHSWAVITGGSDGIGLGFCQELASLGFNICMIARNKQKMQKALQIIKQSNKQLKIETKYIQIDFQQSRNISIFNKIQQQLKQLNISILINNVGISNIGYFHQINIQNIINQFTINCIPQTILTHIIIPNMIKRNYRGAIINLSSFAAQHPIPYISTYAACKTYNDSFSRSIALQYEDKIDILSLRPLLVESNLSGVKKSLTVASRNQCAIAGLKYLGLQQQTNGYWMHRLLATITNCLPNFIIKYLSKLQSYKIMQEQRIKNKK